MAVRLALFSCDCCSATACVPLLPRRRAPASRPCTNGGCWACLGGCQGRAERRDVTAAS